MGRQQSRCTSERGPVVAAGWSIERLTPASRLSGANGLRNGSDGRLYIAECLASRISALNVDDGELQTISPQGGDIIGPDDLAFDAQGHLYVTEFMDGRVSVLDPLGDARVLRDDVPGANGITFLGDRLFVDECRIGGRLLELHPNGGAPRVVLNDLQLPNALAPGPDGLLYFPLVGAGEIWRVHPDVGRAERVVAGLHHPVAVKFNAKGDIVSPQSESGEVLQIEVRSGRQTVLAKLDPGADNLAFIGDRLFVSHHTDGRITEVLGGGRTREVLPGGFLFPLDLALGKDGTVYCADNNAIYAIVPGAKPRAVAWLFGPAFPGCVRGVTTSDDDFVVTTTDGRVVVCSPKTGSQRLLAEGLDQLYGIDGKGRDVIVAERGAGRVLSIGSSMTVLARGLREPMGVAVDGNHCFVSEAGAGRVIKITGTRADTVLDGLQRPHGVAVHGGTLFVVDAGTRELIAYDMKQKRREMIAAELPVGAPLGVTPKPLRGIPPFSGPLGPFSGLTVSNDGTLYVSADCEGSVVAIRRG